jgi:hypothetical protein
MRECKRGQPRKFKGLDSTLHVKGIIRIAKEEAIVGPRHLTVAKREVVSEVVLVQS